MNVLKGGTQEYVPEFYEQVEHIQEAWALYGLIAIAVSIAMLSCMCSMVVCCFNKYKRNLQFYEDSPNNPANNI